MAQEPTRWGPEPAPTPPAGGGATAWDRPLVPGDERTRAPEPTRPPAPGQAVTRWEGAAAPPAPLASDATAWTSPDVRGPAPVQPPLQRRPGARLVPGGRLGPFGLEAELGRGGMGAVWRAVDLATGRRVALKVVLELGRGDAVARERFVREGQLAARLQHPNVVRVFAAGQTDDLPWLACELVPGARSLTGAARGLPRDEQVRLVRDAARALGAAHALGIVHRDVKPDNVLVGDDGRARVADFGLAMAHDVQRLTRTGAVMGTPPYMAPEQFDGDRGAQGPHTDVWALGVILHELLTGERPFGSGGQHEIGLRVLNGKYRRPRQVVADVPAPLEAVVVGAFAQEPAHRWRDGEAFAAALDEALAGRVPRLPGPPPSRRTPVLLVVSAGVLLAASGASVAVLRRSPAAGSGDAVAPVATARPQREATPAQPPSWINRLPEADRPPWPLPAGLVLGKVPGEVVCAKDGSRLVWIPPATFPMGSDDMLAPGPGGTVAVHQVTLSRGYFLGKLEVTWGQLAAYCAATGAESPERLFIHGLARASGEGGNVLLATPFVPPDDHPASNVTWRVARDYCAWAGLRLPTEAEWEYAARGQDGSRYPYPWGDAPPERERLNKGGGQDGFPLTAPVGSFPGGASPFGCLDMAGNVLEHTADLAGPIGAEPVTDPTGPATNDSGERITRGGSWRVTDDAGFLTTYRSRISEHKAQDTSGFRVARSPN